MDQDQVSALDKSGSKNEGIELQIRISPATSPSEQNDPDPVTKHLEEMKNASDEVGSTPENNKDGGISSTETNNVIAELKSEAARDEYRNASVEQQESLNLLKEPNYISENKEKSGTIPVEVDDISEEKDPSQAISAEALSEGEKFGTTSNESKFSTSSVHDKALSLTNRLESSDNFTQLSSDEANVLKYTSNTPSTGDVMEVESLRSLCIRKKDTECGHLRVDDFINEKSETNSNEESILPGTLQPSTRAFETAGDESAIIKNPAEDVETSGFKNTSNDGTVNITNIASEKNVRNEQGVMASETADGKNIVCDKAIDKNVSYKHPMDTPGTVDRENVSKERSNIADKIEILHPKQDENVASEQVTTAKTAVDEAASNETADVGTSETEPRETEDDRERTAFFYMSSSSVPGMGKEWEWPSVSSGHHYQRPPRRMERRRNTAESRNCLGSQRCHYMILAVGVLGAILGCLTYHLQDYGIGPKVLRPIGASAAFLSFVICAFSSVYLTYLSYYTHGRSSHDYQLLDDPVASMLIDTMPQGYNSDPRFYFTSSAAATAQQVFRETQSADALDRRGYSWHQTESKRPFDEPGPSGYDPDSKRFKMDPTTNEGEVYEMKSMRRISEKDGCKERNLSQASDSSHYTLADQVYHSSGESENTENTPLLPKK